MSLLRNIITGLRSLFSKEHVDRELDEELRAYQEMAAEEKIKQGMSRSQALREVRLERGNLEISKEVVRSGGWESAVETAWRDFRFAARALRKAPAFTIAAVLTLALGIGATTSIFTLVHAVLLKSLPVANPHELYRLGKESRCCYWDGYSQPEEFSLVSYGLYKYFQDHTPGFAELAAFQADEPLLGVRRSGGTEPAGSYPGELVSGNYFIMLGIRPYAGRLLTADDDRVGAPPVAVMSYRLWQQQYGSDPSVIGGAFNLNDKPFIVVGVTPPGFFGDRLRDTPPDFFLPLGTEPLTGIGADLDQPQAWLNLIGRVRHGIGPSSVEADMRVELKQWLLLHWSEMNANQRARFPEQILFLRPGGAGISSMRDEYQHWLRLLMIVTSFVLLIVCANVANLMLVRSIERRRETSLKLALGAQPRRLVRQALTESFCLSLVGGAAGLAIAFAGTYLILRFAFPHVVGLAGIPISASPSMAVLLFALSVSFITGAAFGIAPAWTATRVDPVEALRGASRSTVRTGSFSRRTLVILQAALSLVLLVSSGLLTAALHRIQNQNFGFAQERRIILRISPALSGYRQDQLTTFYRRIQDSLSIVPGVSAVAVCQYSPLSGNSWGADVWVDGGPAPAPHDDNWAAWDRVTPGFFGSIGTSILAGRGFSERDIDTARHVAVINRAFARKYFKQENPIGKYFGRYEMASSHVYEIVGVAEDARYLDFDLDKPIGPFFFVPEAQHDVFSKTGTDVNPGSHFLHDVLIVTQPALSVSQTQIRQALASVDPNLPVVSIHTLSEQVAGVFRQQRLIAQLTSFFGALSLILASIGLYGVTAYNVGRCTTEIGVRVALGASRGDVVRLVLRGAFLLITCGLILGMPLSLAASRILSSQLYGLSPYDPASFAIAIALLAVFGLIATLVPALRAMRVDPMVALRYE
ncbi:MAG TPA: ABC transporter permease [Candidatus Acidoferrales bacterium]|nr:ABC transporter permease [Candidatus Acidoferrales bacterium]